MSNKAVKTIVLRTSDKETFEIEEKVAKQSQTLKHMIEDDCANAEIPLLNVTAKTLALVIEYCKMTAEEPEAAYLKAFNADFFKVHQNTLFDLILAANYLNIKSLLDSSCQAVAEKIVGKTPEQIREIFNIKNDFTPEEEAEVRQENSWAFE